MVRQRFGWRVFALLASLGLALVACGDDDGGGGGTDGGMTEVDAGSDSGVPGCTDNGDCDAETEFCEFALGSCGGSGTCAPLVDTCGLEDPSQCGCDGTTYDNRCARRAAGVSPDVALTCGD